MKKVLAIVAVIGLCTTVWGDTLAAVSGSLNETGYASASTSYVSALNVNVNMPYAGNALVFSTFSCKSSGVSSTGDWRLASGSNYSKDIQRYLSAVNDIGTASVLSVFSGLSSGSNTISLQQKSGSASKTLTTFDGNMVIVPLVTSAGNTLNYGLNTMSSTTSSSTGSYVETGMSTTVTVGRNDGGIFLASAFNTQSGGTAVTGTWKMQYRVSGGTWQDVGNVTERYMSGTNDIGAGTLYAMAEGVDEGTYEVRVLFKTNSAGASVSTLNGTVAAVALSYDDANGGGYFPTLAATSSGGTHDGSLFTTIPGATDTISGSDSIVAAMSLTTHPLNAGAGLGYFDLELQSDGSHLANTQENERYLSQITDLGSSGNIGLFTGLAEDVYTVNGRYNDGGNDIVALNVSLAGFSTNSVPEPATMALLAAGGITLLIAKSKKKKLS